MTLVLPRLEGACGIPCGHTFCRDCLAEWRKPECPVCRDEYNKRGITPATTSQAMILFLEDEAADLERARNSGPDGRAANGAPVQTLPETPQGEPNHDQTPEPVE